MFNRKRMRERERGREGNSFLLNKGCDRCNRYYFISVIDNWSRS